MFNKVNTRHLFIVFIALLALALVSIPVGNRKKSRSFRSELTGFDTAEVRSLTIYPKAGGEAIRFSKKGNNWHVSDKNAEYNADNGQVKSMLFTLSELKAKRLAAKGKDSWKKYELTDSLGIRVSVSFEKKKAVDVYIGKFSYTQPASSSPYQRQQGMMTSYVRLADEKEVYAVDGFLSAGFNRSLKDFRDSRVISLQKSRIQEISLVQPGGSFMIAKNDSVWMTDGLLADSAAVEDYLSDLSYLRSTDFISGDNIAAGNPDYTLRLKDKNGIELAVVEAYYKDTASIAVSSSINPGTWFDGTGAGLFGKLFRDKSAFLSQ